MTGTTKRWQVYLLECVDGTFYCGVTVDLDARLKAHNNGTASRYTRARRPVKVKALCPVLLTRSEALKLEALVKKQKRGRKADFLCDRER